MLYKVGDYMHVNSGEKPSEYEIIEIAKYIIHKRYCENDVQSVMSQMDKDIIWQGSEGSGYAAGIEEVGDFLNEENIPNYNISDEEYNITQISSEIYLCSGRMWIETDESENIFFRFHQRVVLIFRWHDDSLKCCNVNISSTYRNIVDGREEIELPIKISYTDYIYLIKKVKPLKLRFNPYNLKFTVTRPTHQKVSLAFLLRLFFRQIYLLPCQHHNLFSHQKGVRKAHLSYFLSFLFPPQVF